MIRIINNDNKYPTIFKEHLLYSIFNSSYKDYIIIEDINNLTISSNLIKLNTYNINKFLKELFLNYEKISFKINSIKLIYHTKINQKYEVELITNSWLMKIYITSNPNLTGQDEVIHLPKLKKKINLKCLSKEEKLAKMFYQIVNETYESIEILYDFYKLYYTKINDETFLIALEKIYASTNEKLKIKTQKEKINELKTNRYLYNKWIRFALKRTDVKINLSDVQHCLNEVITKLKERVV